MDSFLDPSKILERLDLKENMLAVDFGCGSGGWAIPLARELKEGKVFAIDILEEPLSALKGKAKLEKASNIKTIRADVEDKNGLKMLGGDSIDLVLVTNLLFQVRDRKRVIAEAKRILKTGGKVLIIDWKKGTPMGPKEGTIPVEEAKRMVEETGLRLEEEFAAGAYHYGLIFIK